MQTSSTWIRSSRPVLLTGFGPFGGNVGNPSGDVVTRLDGTRIGGHPVISARLPVSFARAPDQLRLLLRRHTPGLVFCVGLASSRDEISLERIAVNIADARIADEDSARPSDVLLRPRGPAAYFSSLPVKAMRERLRDRGLPAELSCTAGTYVCNAVFYTLMHSLRHKAGVRGGFLHVPPTTVISLEDLTAALQDCVLTALEVQEDLLVGMGSEH